MTEALPINPQAFYDFVDLVFRDKEAAAALIKTEPASVDYPLPNSEETLLHYLVIENFINEAQFILEQGANVNAPDGGGSTPLIYATILGYREMADLLIRYRADVNHRDSILSYTALHYAARRCDIDMIKMLLAAGADKSLADGLEETPLDVARKTCSNIMELLAL